MTPARHDTLRGWVEVRATPSRTGPAFAVYDLTKCRAVARLVYAATSRRNALARALRWCSLTARRWTAARCFMEPAGACGALRGCDVAP